MTDTRNLPLATGAHARAVVLMADDADEQTRGAADLLVEYVRKSTGATLPVLFETSLPEADGEAARLFVGRHQRFDEQGGLTELNGLDGDGFVFWPDRQSLTLVGPTSWGTEFAVAEFLERYVGVRWLLPGPDGEDVPRNPELAVPMDYVREEPASRSRVFAPLRASTDVGGVDAYTWGRRNRLHSTIDFHHALWRVLPPSKYYDEHPEWYPAARRPDGNLGWQPCFTASGTAKAAIAEIVAYFNDNPDATSCSIAVNDYSGFCSDDIPNPPQHNTAGFPHLSEVYYRWINEVVEGVLRVHPSKRFGLLAYHDVLDPPQFDLHPAVVPYLTSDRMSWAQPDAGARGRRVTDAWAGRAAQLGWYDYMYGAQYALPRVYFHQQAANHRYGASRGVAYHYAELWPDWGEGPKAWISAKLQWDPERNVDDLLEEWYGRAVGSSAAPDLAAYYELWERFWTERIPTSRWFERWRDAPRTSNYMRFDDPSYLEMVTEEDIALSRRLLDSAVARAETTHQQVRARRLHQKFEYYKTAVEYYQQAIAPPPPPVPESDDQATALLDEMILRCHAADRLLTLEQEFASDPALRLGVRRPPAVERAGLSRTFGDGAAAALAEWFRADDQSMGVTWKRLIELAEAPQPSPLRSYARLWKAHAERRPSLLANGSFEDALADWELHLPPKGTLEVVPTGARTGRYSLSAQGVWSGGIHQEVTLPAGHYGAMVHFRAANDVQYGHLQLAVEMFDAKGHKLQAVHSPATPVWRAARRWSTIEMVCDVLPRVDSVPVARVRIGLQFVTTVEGASFPSMRTGDQLNIDDFMLFSLDNE